MTDDIVVFGGVTGTLKRDADVERARDGVSGREVDKLGVSSRRSDGPRPARGARFLEGPTLPPIDRQRLPGGEEWMAAARAVATAA